ncbi:MAG: L-threonylcarbamoyladenylate synthase [Promethearchaeota archaeon]
MRISITDPKVIPIAVKEFQKGSIVIFPTDTSYGLGTVGLKWNDRNIRQIYDIKSRPLDNPLSLLITKDMLTNFVKISSQTQEILAKGWPGGLTVVLTCRSETSQILSSLINSNNPQKIAFRVPRHEILLEIIDKVGSPIIGTSANKSGSKPKYDLISIFNELSTEKVHLWIDGGKLPENPPSTVIDLTNPLKPILLRRGSVSIEKIF